MGWTDEGTLVCASSEVHQHGSGRLLVMVQGRLPGLAYTSSHHGSSGEHLPVQQDTTGVEQEIDWGRNESFLCSCIHTGSIEATP
jgi:hypothetical protein